MAIARLSKAAFVKRGYGQVEPQHLSAQRTGQIYAQLPANKDIEVLENGQFVKYDYVAKEVNFTGKGEWMMIFNEVKLYKDRQQYEDFAMVKQDYNARVYSPIGQNSSDLKTVMNYDGEAYREGSSEGFSIAIPAFTYPQVMPEGTKMVPRVIKTNVGDLYTTNCVNEKTLKVGDELKVGADGYLAKSGDEKGPVFAVVKVYTLADNQPAVKLQRIA